MQKSNNFNQNDALAIKKVLIANRGEIAVRIIKACKALGVQSVAIYSEADKDCIHVKLADEAVCIGPGAADQSYRNYSAILSAATQKKVDAIHPGYGFLSEDARFAHIVEEHKIKFIGPSSHHVAELGDKINSKMIMEKHGIDTIPGSPSVQNAEEGFEYAKKIGFPVVIKASNGGGGKGIRTVFEEKDFFDAFEAVETEANAILGKGSIYVEKYILNPRHIEFQLLSDGKKAVYVFERECSLQRRKQKVWEEAPSVNLPDVLRHEYGKKIVQMAESVGYEGVGTVEFLFSDGKLYFMEMNTRLQVEHTVTEEITGIDLVQQQIQIASGLPLTIKQEDISIKGHAIQCRITSEDPQTFAPCPGKVIDHIPPLGPYVRIETLLVPNYQIQPFYDTMISKLIVKGKDRNQCLRTLAQSLDEYIIEGENLKTTIPLFKKLLMNQNVKNADFHINWLEEWLENESNPDS